MSEWTTYYIQFDGAIELVENTKEDWVEQDRAGDSNWVNLINEANLVVIEWRVPGATSPMIRFVIYVQF